MRYRINIKTLTNIHIGSGVFLHNNNDFISRKVPDDKDAYDIEDYPNASFIFILDSSRFGAKLNQQEIDNWVAAIDRGQAAEFVETQLHTSELSHEEKNRIYESVSKRKMISYVGKMDNEQWTLKECLHDGMGRPYIPGSSLKGAIRTAINAYMFNHAKPEQKAKINENIKEKKIKETGESFWFGNTLDSLFRFIRVSDSFFESTSARKQTLLNICDSKESLIDQSKDQAVESIDFFLTSECTIDLDWEKYDYCCKYPKDFLKKPVSFKKIPDELRSIKGLFKIINQHTKTLLTEDIKFWKEIQKEKEGADYYIEALKEMVKEVDSCESDECVIRVGQGSSWVFITGGWARQLPDFYEYVPKKVRGENYDDCDFPKSRRISNHNNPNALLYGFLKLSLK